MLMRDFPNVRMETIQLTPVFDALVKAYPQVDDEHLMQLALANTRARLRMTTLYYHAGIHRALVAGTGNKIEDFGVGFFTKYGDGGVDLSPVADLTKTDVYEVARVLGIIESIMKAAPTDGLWGDGRSDADQIGATYPELEWAMAYREAGSSSNISEREKNVLVIYDRMHAANQHKMVPIPVCIIPSALKD
jgi:NAD+ synthase